MGNEESGRRSMVFPDLRKGLNARCVGLANDGLGVARIEDEKAKENGMKVFVEDMLPEERGRVRITRKESGRTFAEKLETTSPSPYRVEPACPEFGVCGGCQLQHADYACQLRMKEAMVRNCLVRIGGFSEQEVRDCMEPILGANETNFYRNQMQYPVEYNRDKNCVEIGLNRRNSHKIVEHEKCYLAHPTAEIVRKVAQYFFSAPSRLEQARALRQVVVRVGTVAKEMMIIFVIRKQVRIDADDFALACAKALSQAGKGTRLVSMWTEERPETTKWKNPKGVWTNIWGERYIHEFLENRIFRISPESFFQVNTKQAVALYGKVKEYLRMDGALPRLLLDLYCGTGSIGIYCSDACHHLIGIESVESAIIDARVNAATNYIEDTEFICGKAEDYDFGVIMPDAIIVDPPRKGCDEQLLKKILKLAPTRIIYVSCNPATLARDLKTFFQLQETADVHYGIKKICPVDMFPMTAHVETVCLLSNRKADSHIKLSLDMDEYYDIIEKEQAENK